MRIERTSSRSTPASAAGCCLVVIPAHNEQADIAQVIGEVRDASGFDLVVVDDASTDDTVRLARAAGVTVLPLMMQLGAWGAIQTGLRYALARGYDCCITMDADGQHEARFIAELLKPVNDGTADVTIGSCTSRGSWLRRVAWVMMKQVSGLSLEDITSGFRVYNLKAMSILSSWQANLLEYQDVGVLALLHSRGVRVLDVEVSMEPRKSGKSRIFHSWFVVLYYMAHTLLLGLSKRGMKRNEADRTGV